MSQMEQPQTPEETPEVEASQHNLDEIAAFKEDREGDPMTKAIGLSKNLDTEPSALINAIARGQKPMKDWNIVDRKPNRPDLDHHSDNPYDFLPVRFPTRSEADRL